MSIHEARCALRRATLDSSLAKSIPKKANIGIQSLPTRSLSSASLLAKEEPLLQR